MTWSLPRHGDTCRQKPVVAREWITSALWCAEIWMESKRTRFIWVEEPVCDDSAAMCCAIQIQSPTTQYHSTLFGFFTHLHWFFQHVANGHNWKFEATSWSFKDLPPWSLTKKNLFKVSSPKGKPHLPSFFRGYCWWKKSQTTTWDG